MPIKGVAPKRCPKCGRSTPKASNYRFSERGACHTKCRRCEDWQKYERAAENKRKKQAQSSYELWRKTFGN